MDLQKSKSENDINNIDKETDPYKYNYFNKDIFDNNIAILQRQTDYDFEKAKQVLLDNNNNLDNALKHYLEIDINDNVSQNEYCNKNIYKNIRKMMDAASLEYEKKKSN